MDIFISAEAPFEMRRLDPLRLELITQGRSYNHINKVFTSAHLERIQFP